MGRDVLMPRKKHLSSMYLLITLTEVMEMVEQIKKATAVR